MIMLLETCGSSVWEWYLSFNPEKNSVASLNKIFCYYLYSFYWGSYYTYLRTIDSVIHVTQIASHTSHLLVPLFCILGNYFKSIPVYLFFFFPAVSGQLFDPSLEVFISMTVIFTFSMKIFFQIYCHFFYSLFLLHGFYSYLL